jgi:uncharacterized protein
VLSDKFKRSRERLSVAEEFIRASAYFVAPTETLRVVADDRDDDRVLECAVAAVCERGVSGDGDLLRMGEFRGMRFSALRSSGGVATGPLREF